MRYPRMLVIHGKSPLDERHIFVDVDGGVVFDNAGPFPPKEARRLHRWLGRYLAAAAEEEKRRYRAARRRVGR